MILRSGPVVFPYNTNLMGKNNSLPEILSCFPICNTKLLKLLISHFVSECIFNDNCLINI